MRARPTSSRRQRLMAAAVAFTSAAVLGLGAPPAAASPSQATGYRLHRVTTPDGVGHVVRWNPCATVTYRVNLALAAGTPSGRSAALADVREAVRRVSARTGVSFRFAGTTTEVPTSVGTTSWWRRQHAAEVVVAWVDQRRAATRSSLLGKDATGRWVAGTGGYVYKYWSSGGTWRLASGRGFLVLDAGQRGVFRPGFGAGVTRGALLLHELGHVMGLGHVASAGELMYPVVLSRRSAFYRSGDRAGLARVGRAAGCVPVPASVWTAI